MGPETIITMAESTAEVFGANAGSNVSPTLGEFDHTPMLQGPVRSTIGMFLLVFIGWHGICITKVPVTLFKEK
jgi:hypothetical protein